MMFEDTLSNDHRPRRHYQQFVNRPRIRSFMKSSFPFVVSFLVVYYIINATNNLSKTTRDDRDDDSTSCQPLPPIKPPNLSQLSSQRLERYNAVQNAIKHAWKGYYTVATTGRRRTKKSPSSSSSSSSWLSNLLQESYCIPDDLAPISQTGNSWLYHAATLHDSLDTLYLAQLTTEYEQAKALFTLSSSSSPSSYLDLQTTSLCSYHLPVKTFEYSLRIVGGLLGAYSVSGDVLWLESAQRATDALLDGPFHWSKTPLPRMYHVLSPPTLSSSLSSFVSLSSLVSLLGTSIRRWYAYIYAWCRDNFFPTEHIYNSLAGIGTFGLEFLFLNSMTQNNNNNDGNKYQNVQNQIIDYLLPFHNGEGGFPVLYKVQKEERPTKYHSRWQQQIGSGADSFYEYLLKIPILKGCSNNKKSNNGSKLSPLSLLQQGGHSICNDHDQMLLSLYHKFVTMELPKRHIFRKKEEDDDDSSSTTTSTSNTIGPLSKRQKNKGNDFSATTSSQKSNMITYPVDENQKVYHHLLCFLPGLLALGDYHGLSSSSERTVTTTTTSKKDLELAKELVYGCYDSYQRTPTGLGPEQVYLRPNNSIDNNNNRYAYSNYIQKEREQRKQQQQQQHKRNNDDTNSQSSYYAIDRSYLLRPELIESLFVLYRVTKNPIYQEWGWNIFTSIERHCKTNLGYAGIKDVYKTSSNNNNNNSTNSSYHHHQNNNNDNYIDDMPSFFIAETLKYLLLLFGPDDFVPLDKYVFTTEAHPLLIPLLNTKNDDDNNNNNNSIDNSQELPYCTLKHNTYTPIVPFPIRHMLLLCILVLSVLLLISIIIQRLYRKCIKQQEEHKPQEDGCGWFILQRSKHLQQSKVD